MESHSNGIYYETYSYVDWLSEEAKCVAKRNIKGSKNPHPPRMATTVPRPDGGALR